MNGPLFDLIQAAFEAGAAEMRKTLAPEDDRITQADAFREFGRAWVELMTDREVVHFYRNGTARNSCKYYSRAELNKVMNSQRIKKDIIILHNYTNYGNY